MIIIVSKRRSRGYREEGRRRGYNNARGNKCFF
jgi:hypothetical protein